MSAALVCSMDRDLSFPRFRAILGCVALAFGYGVAAAAGADTRSVVLSWDRSNEDVTGYRIYFGTAPGKYTDSMDVGSLNSITLSNLKASQPYYFVATAYDAAHLESEPSAEAQVPALPPTVRLTSTSPAAVLNENGNILLTANIDSAQGQGVRVEFLADDVKMGEAAEPPYQTSWKGIEPGTYRLVAVVKDEHGEVMRSDPLAVTVVKFAIQQIEVSPQVGARLTIVGAPGYQNRIYASEDLVQWRLLTTVLNSSGTVVLDDPGAAQVDRRFYKAAVDAP